MSLRGAKAAAADAEAVALSQDHITSASKRVGVESGITSTKFGRSMGLMRKAALGLAVGGLALAVGGFEAIKKSVEKTQGLAIGAATLSKVTGMNINTAAQWLAVSDAYGVSSRTLGMSFKALATQTQGAIGGTKKSVDAFKALGLSTQDLKRHSGDLSGLIGVVADKFDKMPGSVAKTAIATQLFGRGWQKLVPLLSEGSKGMDGLRKTAAAYGVTLGKDPLANARKLHEAEIKLKLAQTGLQVQIAEKLAPAFISVMNKALALYRALAQQLGPAFKDISAVVKDASQWLSKNRDAARALSLGVGLLVVAMIAFKIATLASNSALFASPVGWVVLGLIALTAAVAYCWNHFKIFRTVVTGVWNWLRGAVVDTVGFVSKHWQLLASILTGPFGALAIFVISHFNTILSFITGMPGKIAKVASGLWDGLKGDLQAVVNWIIGIWNGMPFIHGFNIGPVHVPGLPKAPLVGQSSPNLAGQAGKVAAGAGSAVSGVGSKVTAAPRAAGLHINATFSHPIVIDGREIARVMRRETVRAMAANA